MQETSEPNAAKLSKNSLLSTFSMNRDQLRTDELNKKTPRQNQHNKNNPKIQFP